MAITQISRIQCRKGKQENLPQLTGGELGWAMDTRKLYIGNGRYDEGAPELGNTELLTEHSNIFDSPNLSNYTYDGTVVGVNAGVQASKRDLQEKLDDTVNLRDFLGTTANTISVVSAINEAIRKLYDSAMAFPGVNAHRTLIIPAGRYELTGDVIKLLPYVKLRGEGKNVTVIVQTDATQSCVAKSYDSTGTQDGVNIGTNGAIMPGKIELEKITLLNATDNDTLVLDSASDVVSNEVGFHGSQASIPTSLIGSSSCVHLNSSVDAASTLVFNNCVFSGNMYGILSELNSTNVIVNGSLITKLFNGIKLSSGEQAWRITGSYFSDITAEGILAGATTKMITSAYNVFDGGSNTMLSNHIVDLGGDNSYSIGDTFIPRSAGAVQEIKLRGNNSFAFMPGSKTQFGNQISDIKNSILMNDSQPVATDSLGVVGVVEDYLAPTIIEYVIKRGLNKRLGTMKISAIDPSSLVYTDDYVEAGQVRVNLVPTMNATNTNVELRYTSEPMGSTASLTTSSRTLI